MAGSQIPTSVTILNSLKGFQSVSLTEYNTSAAASIAAGSVVEIAGAFFTFVADEAINASSWTAIVTGTTAYITLSPSGTAGSQIVDVAYTATAPTWRDDHQGWYASAASNVRVIGSVYKAEAANYGPKYLYNEKQDGKQRFISVNNASVASSLSVSGVISASSSLSVAGPISGRCITVSNYVYSTSTTTSSAIFTAMSPYIPVTGQSMIVSGGYSLYLTSRAERIDSTTIRLYTKRISDYANQTIDMVSGGALAISEPNFAW
jgi:hypothetical protein